MPKKIQKKKKNKTEPRVQETRPKDFLDLIAPAAVKFNTDHYICGSMYHCTLALRSYPTAGTASVFGTAPSGGAESDPCLVF